MNELTPIGMIYDEEMSKTSMSTAAVAILPTVHELYKSRDLADNNNIQSMSDKVVGGFDEIRDATRCLPDAPMEELLQYFEKNWITNIELWNLFGLDNRTNNACEGGVYNLAISKKSS
ncbi:unnamed protein product [Rotaria socialis]|nr:unnamed protein product [Rotaria socialis]CAF3631375.1 unnamed protein product [Rotaria socialis]